MAGGTNYNVRFNLTGKSTAAVGSMLSAIKSMGNGFNGLKQAVANGTAGLYVFGGVMNGIKSLFTNLKDLLPVIILKLGTALVGAAKKAAGAFKQLVSEGMDLAKIQYEIEAKVSSTFGAGALDAIKAEASRIQGLGVIGDEKILQAANSLGIAGLSQSQTTALMEGLTDIAASQYGLDTTEENMQSLGDIIAKSVLNGTTRSIIQYLPNLDKVAFANADTNERIQMLLDEIARSPMSGANAALKATDMGMVQSVQNQIGDVKEEIGKWGWKMLAAVYEVIEPYLPELQRIGEWVMKLGVEVVTSFAEWLSQHKERFLYILMSLFAKVRSFFEKFDWGGMVTGVLNTAEKMVSVVSLLKKIIGIMIISKIAGGIGGWMAKKGGWETIGAMGAALKNMFKLGRAGPAFMDMAMLAPEMTGFGGALVAGAGNLGLFLSSVPGIIASIAAIVPVVSLIAGGLNVLINKFGGGEKVGEMLANLLINFFGMLKDFVYSVFDVDNFPDLLLAVLKNAIEFFFVNLPGIVVGFVSTIGEAIGKAIWDLMPKGMQEFFGMLGFGDSGGNKDGVEIQHKALGTPYARAGMVTTINEQGGEIMRTPNGTTIIPADKSDALLKNRQNIIVNVNVAGNVIGNKQFIDQVGSSVVSKLQVALAST